MILHALREYYDRVAASGDGKIAQEGWIQKEIHYVVVLDKSGECVNCEPVFDKVSAKRTKGLTVKLPAIGPQAQKHNNSAKDANLLWDNASFVFGKGNKGELKLESFISTIKKWLRDCHDDAGIRAVMAFCSRIKETPELADQLLDGSPLASPFIVFRLKSDGIRYIHDRPAVKEAYDKARDRRSSKPDTLRGTCLVTGEMDVPIARIESVIKGVRGARSTGGSIVSFNEPAFESGGKRRKKGENSPIGQGVSFAYTTALNHLLDRDRMPPQCMPVGDASVVFWADRSVDLETSIVDIFGRPIQDDPDRNVRAVESLYRSIKNGLLENDEGRAKFFVLGLATNVGRIAIRFWIHGTVADMAGRIRQHFDDLEIARSPSEPPYLSLFRLLVSVAVQGKPDNIPPIIGGELMRSILTDLPYPATLLAAAVCRIRAEQSKKDKQERLVQNVTYPRAALIKACINRATRYQNPHVKKELQMSLDKANVKIGYRLGRLFAVLERIQNDANPGINATIRDRYYGAASSTPVTVFSTLLKLKNHHLSKLTSKPTKRRRVVDLEKCIGEIIDGIGDLPARLDLADQGRFAVGYYHQRQDFFKKTDTDTSTEGA